MCLIENACAWGVVLNNLLPNLSCTWLYKVLGIVNCSFFQYPISSLLAVIHIYSILSKFWRPFCQMTFMTVMETENAPLMADNFLCHLHLFQKQIYFPSYLNAVIFNLWC